VLQYKTHFFLAFLVLWHCLLWGVMVISV